MISALSQTAIVARTAMAPISPARAVSSITLLRSRRLMYQFPNPREITTASATTTKRCCTRKTAPVVTSDHNSFWLSKQTWKRSAINTGRCLVGCSIGDLSTVWYLQSAYPDLGMATTMGLSMAAGITTSILLETTLLHLGHDRLPLKIAVRTATGMSMISMLAMEATENTVNYSLTGGCVDMGDPTFWAAAVLSTLAGFLVPLPYNYFRLRAYRKSCH